MSARRPSESLIPVLTASRMREWERLIFASGTADERVIMESAGRAVAAVVADRWPEGKVVAAIGGGNNGGDALVALRTLMAAGREVCAVPAGGAEIPLALAHGWEIPVGQEDVFTSAAVLIDGILGTGASGAPREPQASAIRKMNAIGAPILAIDGPSGVDLTTGDAPGDAIEAAVTVTFGAVKRGLLLHPGRRLAGRILLAEIGFPPPSASPPAAIITDRWALDRLPRIPADAHKGSVGLVGVLAGRAGYGGAAVMVTMGALRAGAGGVRVFSVEANREILNTAVAEAVFFDRAGEGAFEALAGTRAAVIGPGIGTDAPALSLLRSVLASYRGSIVLDADALTLLAGKEELLGGEIASRCVLTPHPAELGRLLHVETAEVLADRFESARAASDRYDCVVLAKGAPTIVVAAGESALVSVSGHSGVATGGMGDTLGGIIGAFLAAGVPPREAAAMGIHFAGRAAEAAGRGRGLLPRDVAGALPEVLNPRTMVSQPARPWPIGFDLPPAR